MQDATKESPGLGKASMGGTMTKLVLERQVEVNQLNREKSLGVKKTVCAKA